jgi:hypothetical protein
MPLTYGASFLLDQTFPEDGIFFRVITQAPPPSAVIPQGIVAAGFRGPWGPLRTPVVLNSQADVDVVFGQGGTTNILREAFNGYASQVIGYRLGGMTGTAPIAASFTVALSTAGQGVIVPLAYVGSRGSTFAFTVKDSLIDSTKREFAVYEGTTLRAVILFDKAPTDVGGSGESGSLMRAINASGSPWLGVASLGSPAPADSSLLAVANNLTAPTVVGTDPDVAGADFTQMQNDLQPVAFNTLCIDTNDLATLLSFSTYAMSQESLGKRFFFVGAEGTGVARSTRKADAIALNSYRTVYFGNGYMSGVTNKDGIYGAAQLAGRIASLPIGQGITGLPILGATAVLDPPATIYDYRDMITHAMLVATVEATGQVVWGEGVTTFITPDTDHPASYGYVEVVRVYDYLQDAIYAAWKPLLNRGNNTPRRRRLLLAAANNVIASLANNESLIGAIIIEDPLNPPQGRRAWFRLGALAAQPLEQAYVTLVVDFDVTTAGQAAPGVVAV